MLHAPRRLAVAATAAACLIALAACTPIPTLDPRLQQTSLSGADVKAVVQSSFKGVTSFHCRVATVPKSAGSDYDVNVSNYSSDSPLQGSYQWVEDYLTHTVTSYWVEGRAFRQAEEGGFGQYPASFTDARVVDDRFRWIANDLTFAVARSAQETVLTASSDTPTNRAALLAAVVTPEALEGLSSTLRDQVEADITVAATVRLNPEGHVSEHSITVTKTPQIVDGLVQLDFRETCNRYNEVARIVAPTDAMPAPDDPESVGSSRV